MCYTSNPITGAGNTNVQSDLRVCHTYPAVSDQARGKGGLTPRKCLAIAATIHKEHNSHESDKEKRRGQRTSITWCRRAIFPMQYMATFVRSRQSMQFTRITPSCRVLEPLAAFNGLSFCASTPRAPREGDIGACGRVGSHPFCPGAVFGGSVSSPYFTAEPTAGCCELVAVLLPSPE